jgi:hypothetical protein
VTNIRKGGLDSVVRPYRVDFDNGAEGIVGDILDWSEVVTRSACSFELQVSTYRPDRDVYIEWKREKGKVPRTTDDKVNPPEFLNRLLDSFD